MAVHSVQPRHTAVPRSLPATMLSVLITVTVLTHGLTLAAASPAPQHCVDVAVYGKHSIGVKTFTSKEGKLLFFPDEDFTGVTITFGIAGRVIEKEVTREDLCVTSSRWNSLEVEVLRNGYSRYQCRYETNSCSGGCGFIHIRGYDIKNMSVQAQGASFWSLNITNETLCATPCTRSGYVTLPVWVVGVAGGAVVVAVVVTVVTIGLLLKWFDRAAAAVPDE